MNSKPSLSPITSLNTGKGLKADEEIEKMREEGEGKEEKLQEAI